jgi:hypothetical protein
LNAETRGDGSFVFEWVPPGDLILNRLLPSVDGVLVESHPLRVRVESGATARVVYGGEGRPVKGRVVGRDPGTDSSGLRWFSKRTLEKPEVPDPDGFATPESYRKSLRTFMRLREYLAQFRVYGVEVGQDGRFRVEDVPPGTYILEWTVRTSTAESNVPPGEPRQLHRVFVVPPPPSPGSSAVVDLGEVNFADNGSMGAKTEATR